MSYIIAFMTTATEKEAENIARNLLNQGLTKPNVLHELWHHMAENTEEQEARSFSRQMLNRKP